MSVTTVTVTYLSVIKRKSGLALNSEGPRRHTESALPAFEPRQIPQSKGAIQ